ncbi:MAG: MGMT family protein [Candidatus Woesearchaeota archaeon]
MKNFYLRVYEIVSRIPKGRVATYKLVAKALNTRAYRAVGNALNKNPYKNVPCHRVVKSNGFVGGYAKGANEKIRILRSEGIKIENNRIVNFEKSVFNPKLNFGKKQQK